MRKLIVLSFVTLDGIMQAPGGPDEDRMNDFTYGGWSVNYWDDTLNSVMAEQMGHPFDMLLGRRTYDIFAAAWPNIDSESVINKYRKYVVTHRVLPEETEIWQNSIQISNDVAGTITGLKREDGPEIQVHGSSEVIHLLFEHDLVDELWLKIYPVSLGKGKRLCSEGDFPRGYELVESKTTPSGVIVANYRRAGDIKFGLFGV
jgi:dihydrofolate reductase